MPPKSALPQLRIALYGFQRNQRNNSSSCHSHCIKNYSAPAQTVQKMHHSSRLSNAMEIFKHCPIFTQKTITAANVGLNLPHHLTNQHVTRRPSSLTRPTCCTSCMLDRSTIITCKNNKQSFSYVQVKNLCNFSHKIFLKH